MKNDKLQFSLRPLHYAAMNGHVGIVSALCKLGAEVDAIDQVQ